MADQGSSQPEALLSHAIFAAGCFWGVQYYFDQIPGVRSTKVGYTGGQTQFPTYEEVCTHTTGHAEAVYVSFDSARVSFATLVKHFFRMHDPTQLNRQGTDIGDSYRSAIFYVNEQQYKIAEQIRDTVQQDMHNSIVTEITPANTFYDAEDYHQKYTEKTGRGMCHIPYAPIKE